MREVWAEALGRPWITAAPRIGLAVFRILLKLSFFSGIGLFYYLVDIGFYSNYALTIVKYFWRWLDGSHSSFSTRGWGW